MFAKLGPQNNVIAVHRARAVTTGEGVLAIHHPINIFTLWSDDELNAIGYARFTEIPPVEGTISISEVDSMVDGQIVRTHNTVADPNYLDKRKAEIMRQVKSQRDTVRDAGIMWAADEDSEMYVVQTDGDSRRELVGAVVGLNERADPEAQQLWRMMNNVLETLTVADFKTLALAVRDHVNACYVRQAALEALVFDAADVTALDAIDVTDGWPAHYVAPEIV